MIPFPDHALPTFHWQQASRNQYRLTTDFGLLATMSLSLERSLLFRPASSEFYRAVADTGDHQFEFKCLFLDGGFNGCAAVPLNGGPPLAYFENRPGIFPWFRRPRILLCENHETWQWDSEPSRREFSVRLGAQRLISLSSPAPELHGRVQLHRPRLLERPESTALLCFCVYLAVGPKRPSPATLLDRGR